MNARNSPGLIWLSAATIIVAMLATGFLRPDSLQGWVPAFMILVFATVSSVVSARGERESGRRPLSAYEDGKEKIKEDGELARMMALLDADDVQELKRRIKLRIAAQIDSGNFSDLAAFEELIADHDRQKRR